MKLLNYFTTENNILIVEFMKCKKGIVSCYYIPEYEELYCEPFSNEINLNSHYRSDELKYHGS